MNNLYEQFLFSMVLKIKLALLEFKKGLWCFYWAVADAPVFIFVDAHVIIGRYFKKVDKNEVGEITRE